MARPRLSFALLTRALLTLAVLSLAVLSLAVLSLAVFVTRVAAPFDVPLDFVDGFLGVTFFWGILVHLLPN
jgi:hypothetical protein